MLSRLFKSRDADRLALTLYAHAVDQARRPVFYRSLGVADRIDARFELYTLHVLLLVLRLRDEEGAGALRGSETAQRLFDVYVSALDNALRELGVGDLSMSKKMRKLGEALYGRMTAYEAPLKAGDVEALAERLARNVHEAPVNDQARALAAYAVESRAFLAGQGFSDLIDRPLWAEIRP